MRILSIFFAFYLFLVLTPLALAIYDPLTVQNNKMGVHILFLSELHEASQLVNNEDKGAWGYVTVPIQATDRDRKKWQAFLDACLLERIIPIVRVATAPEDSNWAEPSNYDLIDFANFMSDLNWPVQNRYVIIFNEVNRSDEYGGQANPEKYADILNNAIDIFKERSEDFFILPAGLDNAAATEKNSISWNTFLSRMYRRQPDIFNKIDGWTSHAYPNPDFSVRPDLSGSNKIDSFKSELRYLKRFTSKKLPVFITETGWSNRYLSDKQVSLYYQYAFSKVWSDPIVVAVNPFLLNAQDGPFKQFSFLGNDYKLKEFAFNISTLATVGHPTLTPPEIAQEVEARPIFKIPEPMPEKEDPFSDINKLYNNLKSLFGLIN